MKDRLRVVTIVPYDETVCRVYGEIKAACESRGKVVGDSEPSVDVREIARA